MFLTQVVVLHTETPVANTTKLNVVYKTTEQGPLKFDLHYPAEPRAGASYPLVISTHGGGWTTGDKTIGNRGVRFMGVQALTEQGFCVASVDYRLWSNGLYQAALDSEHDGMGAVFGA